MKRLTAIALALGLCFIALGAAVTVKAASEPVPPSDLSVDYSSTFNETNYASQSVEAIAGNITALTIHGISQTKAWQGYFGNVTATITLDDASNFTFYNWSSAEPRGQVYATLNSSITWDVVDCFNFTASGSNATVDTIENYYGITLPDADGVNETYTLTNHPAFQVGSRTMSGCPTTYIFQDDALQTSNFVNVLLYDPNINATGWIYTTLIENRTTAVQDPVDAICYNGQPCDFQILVNENGHGTDTSTTTYYFWVELI